MILQQHHNLLSKMPLPSAASFFLFPRGKPFMDFAFKCWNNVVCHTVPVSSCAIKPVSYLARQSQDMWQDLPAGEQRLGFTEINHGVICSIPIRLLGRRHNERSIKLGLGSFFYQHNLMRSERPIFCQLDFRKGASLAVSAPLFLSPGNRSI